jgi:hypothetical protein
VGEVAYKLKLQEGVRLHDVFHVSMLKKFHGNPLQQPRQLLPIKNGRSCVELAAAIKSRLDRERRLLLIKWKGQDEATASWVDVDEFRSIYPSFELADEFILQGGEMSCGTGSTPGAGKLASRIRTWLTWPQQTWRRNRRWCRYQELVASLSY